MSTKSPFQTDPIGAIQTEAGLAMQAKRRQQGVEPIIVHPEPGDRVVVFRWTEAGWAAIMHPGWTEFGAAPEDALQAHCEKFAAEWRTP